MDVMQTNIEETKKKVVKLHIEGRCTISSLADIVKNAKQMMLQN
jgi:hypothetical protein